MENKIDIEILKVLSIKRKPISFTELLESSKDLEEYGKGYILRRCMKLEKVFMIQTEKVSRTRMIKILDLGRALLRVYK